MLTEISARDRRSYPDLYSAQIEEFSVRPKGLRLKYPHIYTDKDGHMVIKRDSGFLRVVPLAEPPRYHPRAIFKSDDSIGSVLQMEDLQTGKLVAAKQCGFSFDSTPGEVEILQRLAHPNIVSYLDLVASGKGLRQEFYMVMEWLSGGTLVDWIKSGNHQLTDVATVFGQTAAAINHVNKTGYLYADAKPANTLFNDEGVVKLVDFGISLPLGSDGGCSVGFILATHYYASPEQNKAPYISGARLYLQSDVYSLTAVLFDVLTRGSARFGARYDFMKDGNLSIPLRPEYQAEITPVQHKRLAEVLRRGLADNYQERQVNVAVLNDQVQEALN